MYYNEHVAKNKDEMWREDDSVTWTYVNGFIGDTPDYYTLNGEREKVKYIAFRDKAELENYSIDWEKVLSVMVKSKLMRIYESLDWGLDVAAGDSIPKSYF